MRAVSDSGNSAWSNTRSFLVLNPAGIATVLSKELKLWPNPVTSILHFPVDKEINSIHMLKSDGKCERLVVDKNILSKGEIDVSDVAAGLYCMRFQLNNGQVISSRILKQ